MTTNIPTFPDLNGKVAVVTGGSGGIGSGTCRMLAANGVKVAVNGRNSEAIRKIVETIRSEGGEAIGITADCTDLAAIERMREETEQKLGAVGVLIAFAGGNGNPVATESITEQHWRMVIDTNLTTTFLTVKSFLPGMIARQRGSIITMASSAGRLPSPASAAYAAAKAGIIMFSRHLAHEVAMHHIRINCIAPSIILGDKQHRLIPEEQQKKIASTIPLGRLGTPQDVAVATLFLASESSSWVTGTTLDISGGKIIV